MGKQLTGYIGTYTKAESEGVYKFVLDLEKERITDVVPAAKLDNPTYLTISDNNQYLYAVSKEGEKGGITAYKIDSSNYELTLLNSFAKAGSPPCHVSVKSDNTNVVTANYHTKEVISYLTDTNGSLKEIADIAVQDGSGPHERQEKPHVHFSGYTPDENYVIAVDLGSDEIITYSVAGDKLTKEHVCKTKAGSGPRHIVFAPNKKYAYVMTELSSEVLTLAYQAETGEFTQKQAIKAIPDDYKEVNDGSAIHISDDGKYVYVGNRGHNSIAVFAVNESTNELTFVEWKSTEGDWPRDFVLDPTNNYLVAANQKSGSLTLYRRNQETGELTVLQTDVPAPEAVCVKFLN